MMKVYSSLLMQKATARHTRVKGWNLERFTECEIVSSRDYTHYQDKQKNILQIIINSCL